jgi:hypothetical protein
MLVCISTKFHTHKTQCTLTKDMPARLLVSVQEHFLFLTIGQTPETAH